MRKLVPASFENVGLRTVESERLEPTPSGTSRRGQIELGDAIRCDSLHFVQALERSGTRMGFLMTTLFTRSIPNSQPTVMMGWTNQTIDVDLSQCFDSVPATRRKDALTPGLVLLQAAVLAIQPTRRGSCNSPQQSIRSGDGFHWLQRHQTEACHSHPSSVNSN